MIAYRSVERAAGDSQLPALDEMLPLSGILVHVLVHKTDYSILDFTSMYENWAYKCRCACLSLHPCRPQRIASPTALPNY